MPLYLDSQYAPRLAFKLEQFKKKNTYLWNFRCPICGDSKTNLTKTRGYIYRQKDDLHFHCHNCKSSMVFGNFLKRIDPGLYKEYTMEFMKSKNGFKVPEPEKKKTGLLRGLQDIDLPTIFSLSDKHTAKRFCCDRLLPKKYFSSLYFAEDFKGFVDNMKSDHGYELINREQRLIIPFINEKGELIGFSGRSLDKSNKHRYMSVRLVDDVSMIYGLNTVNQGKRIYVVEGPFDSMFLENGIAAGTSALHGVMTQLGFNKTYTFIFDNEPRNKEIVGGMQHTLDLGRQLFIWPRIWKDFKDINEVKLGGYTETEIQSIIDANTPQDLLQNKLMMQQWRI